MSASLAWADVDLATKFTRADSVTNTRHNLTQAPIGTGAANMNPFRNDYGEVCVYCHTPHGASGVVAAPLWNRTRSNATYTTYDQLGTSTLTQTVTTPGVNSITCLSCHDGTLGVDSIINMPTGNGNNYSQAQETAQNNAFLDSWTNQGTNAGSHLALDATNEAAGCLACHSPEAGIVGTGATDFRAFALGTDLRNDHPVGVSFPLGAADFNTPAGSSPGMLFFDGDADGRADTNEIRLYDTGEGPEVECASCHDPHGVAPTPGAEFNKTFLRVSNTNSGVCLTCHNK